MTPLQKTICAAAVLLACFPISSTAADIDEDDDGTGKLMVQTFRGWAGIVFLCEYQDPDALLDRICRNARRKPTRAETWNVPRIGFLTVYSADGVAMGTRAELPEMIRGRMATQLQDAVAAFAKYSDQPKTSAR